MGEYWINKKVGSDDNLSTVCFGFVVSYKIVPNNLNFNYLRVWFKLGSGC